jgi:dihydropyrimidinase
MRRADVRCRAGRIAEVGEQLEPQGDRLLDAEGALVFPGIVDPHLHFALVSGPHRTADDFDSGSAAALAGGVTSFIDFARQHAGEGLEAALNARLVDAARSRADSLHVIVTDVSGRQLDELPVLTRRGFTSAKVYTTYRDSRFYCDDHTILRLMEAAAAAGWIVMVHFENDAVVEGTLARFVREGRADFAHHARSRPAIAEIEAVQRMILFARATRCPAYLVHLCRAPPDIRRTTGWRSAGGLPSPCCGARSRTTAATLIAPKGHGQRISCAPVRPAGLP